MDKASQDALNRITHDAVEQCISQLTKIGATNESALMLILIQSFIRMTDEEQAKAKAFVDCNINSSDDDDDDAGWQRAMRARH